MQEVLRRFLDLTVDAPALRSFSHGREMTIHCRLRDVGLEFYLGSHEREVTTELRPPPSPAEIRLGNEEDVSDGMFTTRINAMSAAMTRKLSFKGDTKMAISSQQIQDDLCTLYSQARHAVV